MYTCPTFSQELITFLFSYSVNLQPNVPVIQTSRLVYIYQFNDNDNKTFCHFLTWELATIQWISKDKTKSWDQTHMMNIQ